MAILHLYAGYVASAILIVGLVVYLVAIMRGVVGSNRITWGVWTLVNVLFAVSYYESVGLVTSIWVPLVYLLGNALIFLSLLIWGKPGEWTWVEKISLVGVFLILILWFISENPVMVLTFTLGIDIIGAVVLFVTLWKDPKTDYGPAWLIGFLANFANLLAVEKWDYANAVYPVYLFLLTLVATLLIYIPRPRKTKHF